jgi:ABC-type xylose transport system permease subunit
MNYTLTYGLHKSATVSLGAKVVCIVVGALIGTALGLYVAVRTIPLGPPIQYYYLEGTR